MTVHVLQTLVLYECEKHPREEDWEDSHIGDRISGILMQLISCLQVDFTKIIQKLQNYFSFSVGSVHTISFPQWICSEASLPPLWTTLPS